MTGLAEGAPAARSDEQRLLALICAAHFVSHFYIVMLAPLLAVIRADFAVSYTQLGLALAAFNIVSAVFVTPAGFLVDRVGGRAILIGGLVIGAAAVAGAALLPSYWGFVAMFALLGLGNTVYHPADYALLSQRITPRRMGQAFSIHTFAGMAGSAAAPGCMLLLANNFGWRGAFMASAVLGFAVAAVLLVCGRTLAALPPAAERSAVPAAPPIDSRKLLLSRPMLLNLLLFVLLALMSSGVTNFSVVALDAARGIPAGVTNTGLSVFLGMTALGVLAGGYVAMRTTRHDGAAIVGLAIFAAATLAVGLFDAGTAALLVLLAVAGLASGVIAPSRDMMVRAATPPGAFGKVFGFVTNGFNIGGMISPLAFGWIMDHGDPRGVFLLAALCGLVAIPTVLLASGRPTAVTSV